MSGALHPTGSLSRPFLVSAAVSAALLLAGCGGDGGGERVPLDRPGSGQGEAPELPPGIQSHLDSANAAYRARDYEEALRHFTEVTELAPDLAAGWYGVGMTQAALGNAEEADEAMMRVHRLAPEIPLQHPGTSAPPNPHPEGGSAY